MLAYTVAVRIRSLAKTVCAPTCGFLQSHERILDLVESWILLSSVLSKNFVKSYFDFLRIFDLLQLTPLNPRPHPTPCLELARSIYFNLN